MPIYAFHCDTCGHDFERLQKLSDPDPAACPACGQAHPRRLLSAPQFRLAGGGWYETDFKKDGDRKRNLAESSANADGGGKDSGSKDSGKGGNAGTGETTAKPAAQKTPASSC